MTTHTEQRPEFVTTTAADGRSITSALVIESTRDAQGRYVELEIRTSHTTARGYSASISRYFVDGISRQLSLAFHDGDLKPLSLQANAPKSPRFNKKHFAELHQVIVDNVAAELPIWISWAEQHSHRI